MAASIVEVKINKNDLASIDRLLRSFPKEAPKVMSRAINKTSAKTKTLEARKIKNALGALIKIKVIKDNIDVTKARPNFLISSVKTTGKAIPLINFQARQVKGGVTYKVWKRGARQKKRNAFIGTVFGTKAGRKGIKKAEALAEGRKGHVGVFERTGKGAIKGRRRQQIRQLWGPALQDVLLSDEQIALTIVTETEKDLAVQILSQIDRILERERSRAV